MPVGKTHFDPLLALAALIDHGTEERRAELHTSDSDSFLLLGNRRPIDPRLPSRCMFEARPSLLKALSNTVPEVGDVMKVVRLDPSTVVLYFTATQDQANEIITSYARYVESIVAPQRFVAAWNAFGALILSAVTMIAGGIENLLDEKNPNSLDEAITDSDRKHLEAFAPHVRSLRTFFDVVRAFYLNESMWGRWEEAFFRSQKHFMGNAFQRITLLNYFLQNTTLGYMDLADMVSCAYEVFAPYLYLNKAFVHGKLSPPWIEFELEGKAAKSAIPVDALELKRVIDEIIYRAGAAAEQKPQRIRVHVRDDSVTFANEDGGFKAFAEGSASRAMCERIYGSSRMSFFGNEEQQVTTIALSIAPRPLPPVVFPAGMAMVP